GGPGRGPPGPKPPPPASPASHRQIDGPAGRAAQGQRRPAGRAYLPTQTDLMLQNSRMPWDASSRPNPEVLIPPNGNCGYEVTLPLMNTMPAARSAAKRARSPS